MGIKVGGAVVIFCCLAILISPIKPDSPEQTLSDESLPLQKTSDFDPPITQKPSVRIIRPYEFYKISLRWPKSECTTCVVPAYFTIHGLWPHYRPDIEVPAFDPNNPNRCTNVQPSPDTSITAASLAPILNDMNHYWPSLTNPSITTNLNFWRYEWNKHGKCWNQPQQPIAYFRQALNFARQNSLLDILRRAGITPNNTRRYNWNDIANAINGSLGRIPEINCQRNNNLLREIRVCYDPNRRIDCPTRFSGNCTSNSLLLFPVA